MSETLERLQAVLGDQYRVDREIGRGGMATVYLAHDRKHARKVAVKVLHPGLEVIGGAERFQREIEIAASLSHPNVLPLLDSGSADGLRYYIMPFVDGESLRQRLDREHQLSLPEALRITRAVAAGLSHAHQRGMVHRDIKPENILLSGDQVLVTDFGIARMAASNENLTATGFSLGTPNYMSPEQAMTSRQVDARSDLYSLGCVCYELIAGHPPFLGSSWQEVMGRHAIDSVPSLRSARPSVPPGLERVIERALAKAPADRYSTVADFVAALPSEGELELALTGAGAAAAVPPIRAESSRRRWLGGAVVGLVAVAGIIGTVWFRGRAAPTGDGKPILLAVLPLANVGPPEDEYFADGLSEEIATRLSRVRGIGVIARNARIDRHDGDGSAEAIGRQLGVRYILDGTVRWAASDGSRADVRITPKLIEVETGRILWGDQVYQGVITNVFDLQTQIAERVVSELRVQLGESERLALRNSATENVEAYGQYSLGRFLWKKRTAEGLVQAVAAFERALAADPKYARAHAGLADAYILYPQFGVTAVGPAEAFDRARKAANQALALDSTLAEAHASLGEIATYVDWDWDGAERHFRRAIDLDPGYATARQWYAELLTIVGRHNEALVQAREGRRLDPTSAVVVHAEAHTLRALGRWDEALVAYEDVLQRDPTFRYAHPGMIQSALLKGDLPLAERLQLRFGDTTAVMRLWARAVVDTTRRAEARRVVGASPEVAALPGFLNAAIYASMGLDDQAMAVLEADAAQRGIAALGIKSTQFYDRLRGTPRMKALVAKMNLPPD
ncbi:MAG: protein kinase [Gemmatimonadetes bacterium]|nr:protein kinase [Gemmatimonadota bacterium]